MVGDSRPAHERRPQHVSSLLDEEATVTWIHAAAPQRELFASDELDDPTVDHREAPVCWPMFGGALDLPTTPLLAWFARRTPWTRAITVRDRA